ncbi:hypothetical protein E4U43_001996 [Claviceps pusilla]|uniref:Ankyrin n=1 Tax=Claviceps pusilla TaxID=123648 RepID=A0A9P7SYU2_9HYPO|nr:hypothetical protein E4U43_001996 [Claviceps pusilla]
MWGAAENQLGDLAMKLLAACKSGALPTVRSIAPKLYGGIKPLASDPSTQLPPIQAMLATAAKNGRVDIMRYLMTTMPACINAERRWNPPVPYPIDQLPEQWRHAWWDIVVLGALQSSHIPVVQLLLNEGLGVNYVMEKLGPPLIVAIYKKDAAMARFLLERGAEPNGVSWVMEESFLALATKHPSCDILTALLDHGANIPGSRALFAAARAGNLAAAEVLLVRGADVNEVANLDFYDDRRDNLGTALHAAAEHGKSDMVAFLLKHGARTDLKNGDSMIARDIAEKHGKTDVVKMLDKAE